MSLDVLVQVPRGCLELHHEVELGVVIGSVCRDTSEQDAMTHVAGYALTLDMTARDTQEKVNNVYLQWSYCVSFKNVGLR